MALRPLVLEINPTGEQMMLMRARQSSFAAMTKQIYARDKQTCQYCGYKNPNTPEQGLSIVNVDGNYNNNTAVNLLTACSICTRCVLIGSYHPSSEMDDSVERLIYCPEISQIQLNTLYRIVLVAMNDIQSAYHETAKDLYRSLRHRGHTVDQIYGPQTSDTRVFVQALYDANQVQNPLLKKNLEPLRYLPTRNSFASEWGGWRQWIQAGVSPEIQLSF